MNGSSGDGSAKKVRKPYTITKSRESWTEEEHDKFLEALQLFERDWKKIEDYVGSKTVIQIRSHAQKYFLKVQKNGTTAHVPPPRPKRKATHPYPQKAPKNVLAPLYSPGVAYTSAVGYGTWDDDAAVLASPQTSGAMPFEMEHDLFHTDEVDMRVKEVEKMISSPRAAPSSSESPDQSNQGRPNFGEVYNFIGSIFDPNTKDPMQRLKEMDQISVETVLFLMRNLTLNLSAPDYEPIQKVLSLYDTGGGVQSEGSPIGAAE